MSAEFSCLEVAVDLGDMCGRRWVEGSMTYGMMVEHQCRKVTGHPDLCVCIGCGEVRLVRKTEVV